MSVLRGFYRRFLPVTNHCLPFRSPAVAALRPTILCLYQQDRGVGGTSDGYIRDLTERLLRQYESSDQRCIDTEAFLRVSRDFHYARTGAAVCVFDSRSLLASMQDMRSAGLQLECDPRLRSMMSKLWEDWMDKDAFIR